MIYANLVLSDYVCPACGEFLDSYACKLICHNCGLHFSCDE
jgi:hypothetical protein